MAAESPTPTREPLWEIWQADGKVPLISGVASGPAGSPGSPPSGKASAPGLGTAGGATKAGLGGATGETKPGTAQAKRAAAKKKAPVRAPIAQAQALVPRLASRR